ncbi:hypothetical protein Thi970DRAFT_04617 [Thiorhodovibrio frisius]|uniref:Uncharacterized protein n=1 Tax=Thiorhodovibrio frisius TaxID=631362 RepID=H8Z7K8_9GAMM|nr:hypothetical protein Thi970DRAFT_04617 [Thiorhodovibrio frisius]WPL21997.1 hypothetical protein Thiofri_02143 [Thiorhodovibrio frisius]
MAGDCWLSLKLPCCKYLGLCQHRPESQILEELVSVGDLSVIYKSQWQLANPHQLAFGADQ